MRFTLLHWQFGFHLFENDISIIEDASRDSTKLIKFGL